MFLDKEDCWCGSVQEMTADVAVYRKWRVDNGRLYTMNEADHQLLQNAGYNEW